MTIKTDREYRTMASPFIVARVNKRFETEHYVEGYATTFNDPYLMYEFDGVKYYEEIDARALDDADLSDVIMQYDHAGKVLARNGNNTLGVEIQKKGLFMFADLSKSRAAQDMHEEIDAGLVTKMSWCFRIREQSFDRKTHTRKILKVSKVYDVSAVSYPANPETDISARSFFDGVIKEANREAAARDREILLLKIKMEV